MQPEDSIWGNEEREVVRNRLKDCKTELQGGNEGRSAEDKNAEKQVENGGPKLVSQETEHHGVLSETAKTQLPADKCSPASTKSLTPLSLGVNNLPSSLTEQQNQQKEKVNDHNV